MKDLYFQEELDENLKKGLGALPAAERPSEARATGRAAFLNQVESRPGERISQSKTASYRVDCQFRGSFPTQKGKKTHVDCDRNNYHCINLSLGRRRGHCGSGSSSHAG